MPQPFKPRSGQQVTAGAGIITQRPECATAIVMVCASWAHFEDILLDMFNSATASWQTVGRNGARVPLSNSAALRAYKSVETLHLRHVVMAAAFRGRLSEELLQDFEALMRLARTRVSERNDVAHALWAVCDVYPNDILMQTHGEQFGEVVYTRYTVKDFHNITSRLQALITEGIGLSARFRAYIQRLPPPVLFGSSRGAP